VLVEEHTRDIVAASCVSCRVEEPEPVFDDGAAVHQARVPLIIRFRRRAQASVTQLLRVVAPLHRSGEAGRLEPVRERIASGAWNEIDDRPADLDVAQSTERGHDDLFGGIEPTIAGDATAVDRGPRPDAVRLGDALVSASAAPTEDDHARTQQTVVVS